MEESGASDKGMTQFQGKMEIIYMVYIVRVQPLKASILLLRMYAAISSMARCMNSGMTRVFVYTKPKDRSFF